MSEISHLAARGGSDDAPAPSHLRTLVAVLQWRAQIQPHDSAFTFLRDGEQDQITLTYGDLDREAALLAGRLVQRGAGGETVLLVFEPGVEYVVAFFACLYAGAIAVPVYPPDPFRLARTLPRLQAIVENAGARLMLTTSEMAEQTRLEQISGAQLMLLGGEQVSNEAVCQIGEPDTMALLQYTSGSTGTPRGVIVSHGNLMHNFNAMHQMFDVDDAVVAHWLPPYHDMGLIGCLLLPICSGRHTVAMSPFAFMQKPVRWLQAMDRFRATTSGAPNFGYELCVRKIKPSQCEGLDLSSWRVAVTGAEPVRAKTLTAFTKKFGSLGFQPQTFLPAFGMAEATLIVSGERQADVPRFESFDMRQLESRRAVSAQADSLSRDLVGCGEPAQDVVVRIVDPETRLPLGENSIGEIWLQSPGVGAGYWRDAQRTEQIFRATVANESAEQRFLRTGDMGFLRDGELFITGRRKELIILGGRNLYPLDLEQAVQAAHPDLKVDGGAAFAIDVDGEEKLVVVQELLRPKRHDLDQMLRIACQALVTESGVAPHSLALISAGSLPKTSSGKTRRVECRRQYLEGGLRVLAQWPPEPAVARHSTPPATAVEQELASIWEEVLGMEEIGLEDDFFLLGAKSIRIAAMLGRVSDWLGFEVPLNVLFNNSTLQTFAAALEAMRQSDTLASCELSELPASTVAPLTDAQQRFWFLDRLAATGSIGEPETGAETPSPNAMHIPLTISLQGAMSVAKLRRRLQEIVARHDALRVSFHEGEDGPEQIVEAEVEIPWEAVDLRDAPDAWSDFHNRVVNSPMQLFQAPLVRVGLARIGDEHWRLVVVLHHLIADGWSVALLLRELGEADCSPPRTPGFAAYATWQARSRPWNDRRAYWQQRLSDAPTLLPLASGDAGARASGACQTYLDDRLLGAIHQFARESRTTPFTIYMAAFQIVLSRYADVTDLVVGTVTANRRRPVWEQTIGCFINTVPIRTQISSKQTFSELLADVRDNVIADLENADYPFEQLVEDLGPQRVPGRLPLVQTLLLLQEAPEVPVRIADAVVVDVDAAQAGLAEFDVALVMEPIRKGACAKLHFRHEFMSRQVAEYFLDTYLAVLEAVVETPHQMLADLPIPSKPERLELLVDRNATDRYHTDECPLSMLQRQAADANPKIALIFGEQGISYDELHRLANRVSRHLQYRGVGPNVPVAICMPRGPGMVAAMLAVLKAGGAFVPLDPTHPEPRRQAVLRDCQPLMVISGDSDSIDSACRSSERTSPPSGDKSNDRAMAESIAWSDLVALAKDEPPSAPAQNAGRDDLAYLIFTSGTTGEPKGVMITRRGLGNFLHAFARSPGLDEADRVLAHTTVSFDISILELLLPLCVGGQVILAPCGAARDPRALMELIRRHDVTFLQATPSGFRILRDAGWLPTAAMRMMAGGETLSAELARFLLAQGGTLWNVYGPTETTIWSTLGRVTMDDLARCRRLGASPAIGKPIDNTQVYVLDGMMRPVPVGVVGDLYIGGAGVAIGYWRKEQLTAERFLADEFQDQPGHTMYHTGDRVRWRADGRLEFWGRDDAQAKVRGFRVELGEVESALLAHPLVCEAAVMCEPDGEDNALVAYVVWAPDQMDFGCLRDALASQLPHYMIPTTFHSLASMPYSTAGKVDRRRLACSAADNLLEEGGAEPMGVAAPSTPLEEAVAKAWEEVLGRGNFGVHDRFFEIGGHSLKAIRVLSRLESRFDVRLDVQAFFQDPTISGAAQQLLLALAEASEDIERLIAEVEAMNNEESPASRDVEGGS